MYGNIVLQAVSHYKSTSTDPDLPGITESFSDKTDTPTYICTYSWDLFRT